MKSALTALGLVFLAQHAAAADFCDAVIVNRAFNTTNVEQQSTIYNKMRTEMCNESWSSYEEFKNKADNLGINVGYAAFSFGLSGSTASGSGVVQASRDKYCSMSDAEFYSDFSSRTSVTVADAALTAWTQCVQAYLATQTQGLFATVADGPDYDYFDIKFDFRTPGNQDLELTALSVSTPSIEVKCAEGTTELNPNPTSPYVFKSNTVTIRCTKSEPSRTLASINTNAGTLFALVSYGQSASAFEREELTQAIADLTTQMQDLHEALEAANERHGSDIETVSKSINDNALGTTDLKNRYEHTREAVKYVMWPGPCPAGYNSLGDVGIIMRNAHYSNNRFGPGSPFNNDWTWSHPGLCERTP